MAGYRVSAPPGRAGRLWLDRRLSAARQGAALLDRKLRVLAAELATIEDAAAAAERDWRAAAVAAERSLLIAALTGGQRAIGLATPAGHAEVRVGVGVTIGVRHPAGGDVRPPAGPAPWAGAAVSRARAAHERALRAAVSAAAAAAAVRIMRAEADTTRYRLHAIRDRLIPGLEQARAQVLLAIDEEERGDGTRLRRASAGGNR
ncbi:MAG: V-type ATP synthase subunit D [Streptosporangiaceae bacterium]